METKDTRPANERLKEARCYLGYNKREFGQLLGLSDSGYGSIENGKRKLQPKYAIFLEQACDISKEWLLNGVGQMMLDDENRLSPDEEDLISMYRKLPMEAKDIVRNLVDRLSQITLNEPKKGTMVQSPRER